MKCRSCGYDTGNFGVDVPHVGPMHVSCEIERLRGHLTDANRGAERQSEVNQILAKELADLRAALSEKEKHLADANRGAQRQAEVNQLLVKELVEAKNALAAKDYDKRYPCQKCGKLRTEAEGGTTFTVCDACWDKYYQALTEGEGHE